jgi:hypothetical protein
MASISMPDLPDGPRRRLVSALHSCYEEAGRPTLKAIDEWICAHPGLPATVSKETVRRMLVGLAVPRTWDMADTVFLALCGMAGRDPDEPADDAWHGAAGLSRQEAFRRCWQAAVAAS